MNNHWRQVFRDGLCPQLPLETLRLLQRGLAEDDPRLIQRETVALDAEGRLTACLIGFCGICEELDTEAEVKEFFVRVCQQIRHKVPPTSSLHESHSWLTYFWDDTPRPQARALVLEELDRVLAQRATEEVVA